MRPPRLRDGRTWSEIRLRNEMWLLKWEPTSPHSWVERNSVSAWPPLLSALRKAGRAGTMLPFVITYQGAFAGQMNVSNVVHGVLKSCTVGYWVDRDLAGRGIVPTALALVIDHCLAEVGLHRVEVDIRPENTASLRVVEKLGFTEIGTAPGFLHIAGDWRDHRVFQVLATQVGDGLVTRLSSTSA